MDNITSAIPQAMPQAQDNNIGDQFANLQNTQQTTQQPQSTAQPQKGNWFERLLPTLGGVAGGVLGSMALPFVGGIGGAAAGGALGQKLENVWTGSNGSTAGAATSNAIGGALGGAVGGGLKLLAGKFLAPTAEKVATRLVAGQAPKGAVTPDLATYLTGHGIGTLDKAGSIADVMTGGTAKVQNTDGLAELTKFVENTLQNTSNKPLDLSSFQPIASVGKNAATAQAMGGGTNTVEQAINASSLSGTPSAIAVRSKVGGVINSLENPGSVAPLNGLAAQRQVSGLASDAYNAFKKTGDNTALNEYKAYRQINSNLSSTLGLDKIAVSPEDQQALATNIGNYIGNIDKGAGNSIQKEIMNLQNPTLADFRHLESNWVQVKSALNDASQAQAKNFGMNPMDAIKGVLPLTGAAVGIGGPKALVGAAAGASMPSVLDKALAPALLKSGGFLKSNVGQKTIGQLSRIAGITASNVPNLTAAPLGGANSMNNQPQNAGGTQQPITELFKQLLAQEQAGAGLTSNSGSIISALQALAAPAQQTQMLGNLTGGLGSSFANAGGAQGLGGGLVSRLSGLFPGTAANQYGNQQQGIASLLQSLYGIQGGAGLTPQLTQNPATANIAGQNLGL